MLGCERYSLDGAEFSWTRRNRNRPRQRAGLRSDHWAVAMERSRFFPVSPMYLQTTADGSTLCEFRVAQSLRGIENTFLRRRSFALYSLSRAQPALKSQDLGSCLGLP